MDKVFVGRKKELEDFDKFLAGERANYGGRDKGALVLQVIGEQGIGKTALLQEMAQRAASQGHFVIAGEVDKRDTEFSEQIYPLIARLKGKKGLELGKRKHWLKASLSLLVMTSDILGGLLVALFSILEDIRAEHKNLGSTPVNLARLFHYEQGVKSAFDPY